MESTLRSFRSKCRRTRRCESYDHGEGLEADRGGGGLAKAADDVGQIETTRKNGKKAVGLSFGLTSLVCETNFSVLKESISRKPKNWRTISNATASYRVR